MRKNRFLAGVLSAAMVVGSLTLPENISIKGFDFGALFAQAAEEVASGTCGENLTWVLDDDGVLTISGTGDMDDYGYGSSAAAEWYGYRSLINSIVIEEGVTSIGDYAFAYHSLTNIEIPDSVTTIGRYAFSYCTSLTYIKIPDGVTAIEISTFGNCTSLTNIEIPGSVAIIESEAFKYCTSLTNIEIPDSVMVIESETFEYCTSLTSIEIPDGVTAIDYYTFKYCSSLTSVEIPDSVTSIDYGAFEYCTSLINIEIPGSVTAIGTWAFEGCSGLTNIKIPEGVHTIGSSAFSGCSGLAYIEISDSVTVIRLSAFSGCENITDVYYSGSEEEWNEISIESYNTYLTSATIHCNSTVEGEIFNIEDYQYIFLDDGTIEIYKYIGTSEEVEIPAEIEGIAVTSLGNDIFNQLSASTSPTSVILPDSITNIGDSAFKYCNNLTSINIPAGVTSIGGYAFSGCAITEIDLPDGLTSISDGVFFGCDGLTEIDIPDAVTSIGRYAFASTNLTEIEIPDSVTSIGADAFYNCTELTTIQIPEGVTEISDGTFKACSGLADVVLPEALTDIGDQAFEDCTSLVSIEIPENVESIGKAAFNGCTGLTDVYYPSSNLSWKKIDIDSDNECLTSANIHFSIILEDKTDELHEFMTRTGFVSEINYLCTADNFPNSIFVEEKYDSTGSLVVKLLTDSLYRGFEGWRELFTSGTSVDSAEQILAALLEAYQSECEAYTTAKSAQKYSKLFVDGLQSFISAAAIDYSTCNTEDFDNLLEVITEKEVEEYLIDGKFSTLSDILIKKCGYSSDSEIVTVLNDYMTSETWAKNLSEGLKFLGAGIEILSATEETINYVYQMEALMDADEIYLEMLLYLQENASNSIVQEAAGNLYEVINGTYLEQMGYVTSALQNKVADKAIDTVFEVAAKALPCTAIIKKAFDFGIDLSNLIFHTADVQELKDNMYIITGIGDGLSEWVSENRSAYLRAYKNDDQSEQMQYAKETYYGLYMLWLTRKAGEENLQSMLEKSSSTFSVFYDISLAVSSSLEAQKGACFSSWDIEEIASLTTEEATIVETGETMECWSSAVVACPVDVEVYDENGTLLATIYDGEEVSEELENLRYDVVYNVLDDDYVKIICFPEGSNYTFNYVGVDTGLVDSYIMTITDEGETELQYFENIEISEGDVVAVSEVSDSEYSYTVTKADTGEVIEGTFITADEYISVESVTLSESDLELEVGEKKQITFTVTPDEATNQKVVWQSSDENVATVNSDGVVTAVSVGTVEITATAVGGDATATCTLVVTGTSVTLGDVNQDGEIDYLDAMTVLRYDAELITLDETQLLAGDVNGDEVVDSLDAILILRYDADLITEF